MEEKYWLIGLGNPGAEYQGTRHNLGHWVIQQLNTFSDRPQSWRLYQTQSWMNQSGMEVKNLLKEKNFNLQRLVVIHDEADLALGDFRIHFGRGSAGHRGVESIIRELGTKNFWRWRIGIGRPVSVKQGLENFILSKFSEHELRVIQSILPSIVDKFRFITGK